MPGIAIWPPRSEQITGDYPRSINAAGDFKRYALLHNYVGFQAEGDYHKNGTTRTCPITSFPVGLVARSSVSRREDITPFVHALVGGESVSSTYYPSNKWGIVLTAGGGLDYNTPWIDHHLKIRVFQADYQYIHENMYPVTRGNFNMARLSTGIVIGIDTMAPPPTDHNGLLGPTRIRCSRASR